MGNVTAKSILLVILAMGVGIALGAATKFGFGYDLSVVTPSSKILATQ
jgi:hypothetical protein